MMRPIITCISLIFALTWFTGIALAKIDMKTVVGAWTFDEGAGDVAIDSSGNCEDGKINGATWVDGKFGKALSFDGASNYVEVPDISDLNPQKAMSMGCWVYITGNAGVHRDIISKDGESAERQYLMTSSDINRFRAHIWTSDGVAHYFDGGTPVELETWYHIAQTYDGSDLKLYVDGKEDGSISFSGDIIVTGQPVRIGGGANPGSPAYHTPGIIDEVVIFNVALEEEDVQTFMNTGLSGLLAVSPADKLAACWGQVKVQYYR